MEKIHILVAEDDKLLCQSIGNKIIDKLTVCDALGRVVINLYNYVPNTEIQIETLHNGVYFVKVSVDGEQIQNKRLIITK